MSLSFASLCYFLTAGLMSLSFMFVFYFVYSVFLYCFVYCSPFVPVYSCLFPIFAQVYRPLPPGGNPTALKKYRIVSYQSCMLLVPHIKSPYTDRLSVQTTTLLPAAPRRAVASTDNSFIHHAIALRIFVIVLSHCKRSVIWLFLNSKIKHGLYIQGPLPNNPSALPNVQHRSSRKIVKEPTGLSLSILALRGRTVYTAVLLPTFG